MESQNNLETTGNLRTNPLAELLFEISQNKLNGSLRLTNETEKIVAYFDAGELIFAVSNARRHRLFEMLLQAGKMTKETLAAIPEFTNDLALKKFLLENDSLADGEFEEFSTRQISDILETALQWQTGDWTFSPLVRIKGDIRFQINLPARLAEYARSLPAEEAARKFTNRNESFIVNFVMPANVNLSTQESFVFSRFETSALTIGEIQILSGLPEAETFRILYALWLGGFIKRQNWSAAFSERKIAAILSARLAVKKAEAAASAAPSIQPPEKQSAAPPTQVETEESPAEETAPEDNQVSLEEYLNRVETAANFYEIFALSPKAAAPEIKQTYFALAKRFHPDIFHKETDTKLLQRVQNAFTQLAQAYDTLKTESSRDMYDFKMRKELAEVKAAQDSETTKEEVNSQKQADQAAEQFEKGFAFLMDDNPNAAVPFLARAAHFDKNNARYRAYYGKALAADNKQRHKAESELQAAVKLDNQNAAYRIMLAEFFIQFELLKRAEGELNRLLAIFPDNREAKTLLDSLPKKRLN